jgi:ribosomal protein L27
VFRAGRNAGLGRDFTIYARKEGKVSIKKRIISVVETN